MKSLKCSLLNCLLRGEGRQSSPFHPASFNEQRQVFIYSRRRRRRCQHASVDSLHVPAVTQAVLKPPREVSSRLLSDTIPLALVVLPFGSGGNSLPDAVRAPASGPQDGSAPSGRVEENAEAAELGPNAGLDQI